MKFLIQRVLNAKVTVDHKEIGNIEKGLLVFVGICNEDTKETADKMMKKLFGLRIFEDSQGKTNLDIKTVNGQMMIISQFTLYADCKKGNRPSFINAGEPGYANELYEYILDTCLNQYKFSVQHGSFGADMKVSLVNDGPFTIMLDSKEL